MIDRVEWAHGDLFDMPSLHDAMTGVERVYHAAAVVSFDPRDTRILRRTNVEGTANVVNAALVEGVHRLCHVSSTATIGVPADRGERHEGIPFEAGAHTSPYALSKHLAELEVHRGIAEGLDAVMVNPCVVIGPGAPGRSSMTLLERLQRGTRFYPQGSNAVVDARDVAYCTAAIMERGATGERHLLIGANIAYKELFRVMSEAFGKPAPSLRIPPWTLELAWRLERLRSRFGGRPFITRHTAYSANEMRRYSNAKVKTLLGHRFHDVEAMAVNMAAFMGPGTA
jgi:nucleoside-diphosphate-sugar epimerase